MTGWVIVTNEEDGSSTRSFMVKGEILWFRGSSLSTRSRPPPFHVLLGLSKTVSSFVSSVVSDNSRTVELLRR